MLWALKRAYEKHSPEPQRVNFTKVVKNADSRDKFIKQAAQSPIAEVSRHTVCLTCLADGSLLLRAGI